MVELQPLELLSGIFAIIIVIFSTLAGILIASKYFEKKKKSYLFLGLTWVGLVEIWWGISISIIYILLTGSILSDQVYMIIGMVFYPLTTIIGMYGITELILKKHQRVIVIPYVIYGIFFEIVFFYFIITDYTVLGKVNSPVDATYNIFVSIFQIICLLSFSIFGSLFAISSMRSNIEEVKLRGKFLFVGINFFLVGAIFEIIGEISILILIIGRLILVCSSFLFYSGFVLPNWMKNILLSKNQK